MHRILIGVSAFGLICLSVPAPEGSAAPSPYVGQEQREIKALSADDIAALERGEGMGLAKAAELNRFPGPRHVLDLAEPLGVTPGQLASTERLFADMHSEAVTVGRQILALEHELDGQFRSGNVNESTVTRLSSALGSLQGQLRASHLLAHVRMHAILTPDQIERYQQLRGYKGGMDGHMHGGDHHSAPH